MRCPYCNIEFSFSDEKQSVYRVDPILKVVKKRRIVGIKKNKLELSKPNKSSYPISDTGYFWYECGNCGEHLVKEFVLTWLRGN